MISISRYLTYQVSPIIYFAFWKYIETSSILSLCLQSFTYVLVASYILVAPFPFFFHLKTEHIFLLNEDACSRI